MTLAVQPESPPLREDVSGAVRIGQSRVLLELVVNAFQDGATPEAVVQRYPTLALGDVYAVIAYYLRHRAEVDQYMIRREQQATEVASRIDAGLSDLSVIRERLQARRGN